MAGKLDRWGFVFAWVLLAIGAAIYFKPRAVVVPAMKLADRLSNFPRLVVTRDRSCSLAEAWRSATMLESGLERERIAKTVKVLRSDGNLIEAQTPLGNFWLPAADLLSLTGLIYDYEIDLYGYSGAQIRAGDTVLDCGANIGTFTRFALNRGAKRVIAIEIAPDILHCLRRTFAGEIRDRRVIVFPKGVWNEDAELTLRVSDKLSSLDGSVVFQHESAGPKVLLTTIDKITAELQLEKVDFIKMDIEGAESKALQGAVGTISRFTPRLAITLEHRHEDQTDIPQFLTRNWPDRPVTLARCGTERFGQLRPMTAFVGP